MWGVGGGEWEKGTETNFDSVLSSTSDSQELEETKKKKRRSLE